jgi:hypothetical protein
MAPFLAVSVHLSPALLLEKCVISVKSYHDGFKLNVVEYAEKARAQYWEERKFITCEKPVKGLGHESLC